MRLVKNRPLGEHWVVDTNPEPAQLPNGTTLELWCATTPLKKLVTLALPDGSVLAFKPRLEVHPSVRIYSTDPACSVVPQDQVRLAFVPVGKNPGTLEPVDPPQTITYPQFNDGPYGPGAGQPGVCRLQGGYLSKGLPGFDPKYEPVKSATPRRRARLHCRGSEGLGVPHRPQRQPPDLYAAGHHPQLRRGHHLHRDPAGRISAITDPAGQQLLYSYDPQGRLVTFTDRNGAVTEYRYTNTAYPFYLTEIIDPLGHRAVKSLFMTMAGRWPGGRRR